MKSATDRPISRRNVRIAGFAAAGALAFAAGAMLSSPPAGAGHDAMDVVAPVLRVRADALKPTQEIGIGSGPQSQPSDRLNGQVVHNPFGGLNLNAGAGGDEDRTAHAPVKAAAEKRSVAPKPAPPAAPAPPVAPPLPFTAVGSISGAEVTGGQPVAFIKQLDRLLIVRAGDAVGPSYRIEAITAQRIEFMYLPLMQRQTLALAP